MRAVSWPRRSASRPAPKGFPVASSRNSRQSWTCFFRFKRLLNQPRNSETAFHTHPYDCMVEALEAPTNPCSTVAAVSEWWGHCYRTGLYDRRTTAGVDMVMGRSTRSIASTAQPCCPKGRTRQARATGPYRQIRTVHRARVWCDVAAHLATGRLVCKHAFLLKGLGWGGMPLPHRKGGPTRRSTCQAVDRRHAGREPVLPMSAAYLTANPPGPAGRWLIER